MESISVVTENIQRQLVQLRGIELTPFSCGPHHLGKCSRDDAAKKAADMLTGLSIQKHHLDTIAHLRALLTKLENGWDGRCTCCGVEIPLERLLAVPTLLCVDCAKKAERKQLYC